MRWSGKSHHLWWKSLANYACKARTCTMPWERPPYDARDVFERRLMSSLPLAAVPWNHSNESSGNCSRPTVPWGEESAKKGLDTSRGKVKEETWV